MNSPKEHFPRLKDVAEAVGVTRMTVSLALRNHPSISQQTRERVQQVAAKMGYRPDPEIGTLMEKVRARKQNRRRQTIAYLTAHVKRGGWMEEPTQRLYFEGAYGRAEELGYMLEEFWLNEAGMTEQRLSEIIWNRGIEGVIVAPMPIASTRFQQFNWNYFSSIGLGYSLIKPELHRCCNHQFQSMMLLIRQLQIAGYRKIGLAMEADQDERVNHNWKAAYLMSLSQKPPPSEIPALLAREWNQATFTAWLEKYMPEVVVSIGPDSIRWLRQSGLRCPEDIGIANVDLRPDMVDITGINQNSPLVGAAAVDSLITFMRINERGIPQRRKILMIEGDFVQGRTTRPAPSARI